MSRLNYFLFILVLTISIPISLKAGSWEIGPFVGERFGGRYVNNETGKAFNLNAAPVYGFTVGRNLDFGHYQAELLYSRQETDIDLNGFNNADQIDINVDQYYFGLLQHYLVDNEKVRPFLEGLVGFTHFGYSNSADKNYFSLGASGGVKYMAAKNVGLRLDARVYATFTNGSTAVACSGGCAMNYSGTVFWQGELSPSVFVQF